jgi:FkbM family methyltransferase
LNCALLLNHQEMSELISYAQNFEDVMLWRALKHVTNGYYIDVGAQDPTKDSVSKLFCEQGWRGLHVEPTARYAEELRRDRPNDIVLQAAVSETSGALKFFEFPDTGLSTDDSAIAKKHMKAGFKCVETIVPCLTLDAVLQHSDVPHIHWLKIDVEGGEERVLKGWLDAKQRPWIVVIESTAPLTQRPTHAKWEALILAKGYVFAYFDGLNRFYFSRAHPELRKPLSVSPNIFDGFKLSRQAWPWCTGLHIELLNMEGELARERAESTAHHVQLSSENQARIQALQTELDAERERTGREIQSLQRALSDQAAEDAMRMFTLRTDTASAMAALNAELAAHRKNASEESERHARRAEEFAISLVAAKAETVALAQKLSEREREYSAQLLMTKSESAAAAQTQVARESMLRDELSSLRDKFALEMQSVMTRHAGELGALVSDREHKERQHTQAIREIAGALQTLVQEKRLIQDKSAAESESYHVKMAQMQHMLAEQARTHSIEIVGLRRRLQSERISSENALADEKLRLASAEEGFREKLQELTTRTPQLGHTLPPELQAAEGVPLSSTFDSAPARSITNVGEQNSALPHAGFAANQERKVELPTRTHGGNSRDSTLAPESIGLTSTTTTIASSDPVRARPPPGEEERYIGLEHLRADGIHDVVPIGRQLRLEERVKMEDRSNFGPLDTMNRLLSQRDTAFIDAAYRLILGRAPDAGGLKTYLTELRNGRDKMSIVTALRESTEAVSTRERRNRFAQIAERLGRMSESDAIKSLPSEERHLLEQLLSSGDDEFVAGIYGDLLGRQADQEERASYHAQIKSGASRLQVIQSAFNSPEAHALKKKLGHVLDATLLFKSRSKQLNDARVSRGYRAVMSSLSRWPLISRVANLWAFLAHGSRLGPRQQFVTIQEVPQLVAQQLDLLPIQDPMSFLALQEIADRYRASNGREGLVDHEKIERISTDLAQIWSDIKQMRTEIRQLEQRVALIETKQVPAVSADLRDVQQRQLIFETEHLQALLTSLSKLNDRQLATDRARENLVNSVPIAIRKITREVAGLSQRIDQEH